MPLRRFCANAALDSQRALIHSQLQTLIADKEQGQAALIAFLQFHPGPWRAQPDAQQPGHSIVWDCNGEFVTYLPDEAAQEFADSVTRASLRPPPPGFLAASPGAGTQGY